MPARAPSPAARACGCAPTARRSGAAGAPGSRSACQSPQGPRRASPRRGSPPARRSAARRSTGAARACRARAASATRSPRPARTPSRRRGSRSLSRRRRRRAPAARARRCAPGRAAAAPRAARRGRSAAAAREEAGAARPRRPRARSGRSRWSARRRSAARGSRRLPILCSSRNAASGSSTSSGSRASGATSAWVRTMSSGATAALIRPHATERAPFARPTGATPHAVRRSRSARRARWPLRCSACLSRREPVPRGDEQIYERMAQHPFGTHTFPFAYRVGLPWFVHVLPFSHTTSFLLLAWLAAGGAAAFAFALMRRLEAPAAVAAPLAFALAVSPPLLIVALRDGRNPDAVTMLFMMAATLLVVQRRPRALALTLLVGVLFREAVLFVIPLAYAVWAASCGIATPSLRTLAAGLPAARGVCRAASGDPNRRPLSRTRVRRLACGRTRPCHPSRPGQPGNRAAPDVLRVRTAVAARAACLARQPLRAPRVGAGGVLAGVDDASRWTGVG